MIPEGVGVVTGEGRGGEAGAMVLAVGRLSQILGTVSQTLHVEKRSNQLATGLCISRLGIRAHTVPAGTMVTFMSNPLIVQSWSSSLLPSSFGTHSSSSGALVSVGPSVYGCVSG